MNLHSSISLYRDAIRFTAQQMNLKPEYVEKDYWVTLPEVGIEGITHKKGMNRKTAHAYTKEFSGDYGQARDVIILESSW